MKTTNLTRAAILTAAAISSLGGRLADVVRTRVYLTDVADCDAVARVHGRYFGEIRPANTLLQVAGLVGDGYLVEMEAEAVVGMGRQFGAPR